MTSYIKGGLAAILVVASLTAGIGISTASAHDKELAADGCHWETISPSHRERHCHDDNSWKTIGISAAVLAALWVISEAMDDSKFVDQLLPPHREDAIDWDFNASADGVQVEFHIPVDF